jgi:ribose transport system permease protein
MRVVKAGPLIILVTLVVLFTVINPLFVSGRNLQNLAVQSSLIAALAIGVLLPILTQGIDLSVGSVVALSTVMGAVVFHDLNAPAWVVIGVIIGTGGVVGLVNGVAYVKGRIPHPFIVTLAMMSVARGAALLISDGQSIAGMPEPVQTAGSGYVGAIPVPALIVGGLALLAWFFTTKQVWGRWIYAVGGNPAAAREVGIPVARVLISVYVISGLCAGVAGLITAGRTNSGFPTAGNLSELDAIAGVIIGGASFFGGRGTVVNAVIGAVIIASVRNGLNMIGVDTYAQYVALGLIVFLAVQMDVQRSRIETRFQALEGRTA